MVCTWNDEGRKPHHDQSLAPRLNTPNSRLPAKPKLPGALGGVERTLSQFCSALLQKWVQPRIRRDAPLD
jgi:hypothetical protein